MTASDPGVRYTVDGVSGPFLRGSSVEAVAAAAPGSELFIVRAAPDCRDAASLDPSRAPYLLTITRTGPDGRSVHGLVRVNGSPVDWDAVVRQACWQALTSRTVLVEAVRTELRGPREWSTSASHYVAPQHGTFGSG